MADISEVQQEPATESSRRILIVDDDRDFAESLADVLEHHGYELAVAGSADEACAKGREFDPNVALLDIRLGPSSGTELIGALRATRPGLLCVMVTAYAELDTAVESLQSGAYDYLRKPLDVHSLLAVLERAFDKISLEQEKKQALAALRERDARIRLLLDSTAEGICGLDARGYCRFVNRSALRMLGQPDESALVGRHLHELIHHTRPNGHARDASDCSVCQGITAGTPVHEADELLWRGDGTAFRAEYWVHPVFQGDATIGAVLTFLDITAHKRSEEERAKLEAQFRHAQKMEAVGQLAGGVAHDFNNLLTAILGNVELLRGEVESGRKDDQKLLTSAEEIERAGHRASSLTRQLLAFSRRQMIKPEILNVNLILSEMERMLHRLIGENITLKLALGEGTPPVRADAGQFEQVIMNLTVNARDAMPDGGTLEITTAATHLDERYCQARRDVQPGPYVQITIRDNGRGMDAATLERIFEPFFTTKPTGRGTGLGLSTTYGIVNQAGGHINVESSEGVGTRFDILLPAAPASAQPGARPGQEGPVPRGTETVLVCEDEPSVRQLAEQMLARTGFKVLTAENAAKAIAAAREHPGAVDLLLTDVILPDQNGKRAAEEIMQLYPHLRVLYMSGYTADVIAKHGVLQDGVEFIDKPFTLRALVQRVREVLDR